jgi:hypothetical protein
MVERHAVAYAPSAVMPHDRKLLEPKSAHRFHLIERHGTFRVIEMIFAVRGLAAVPIASKVGHNQCKFLRELGRELVPLHMRLRMAVQEEHGRAIAARNNANDRARRLNF